MPVKFAGLALPSRAGYPLPMGDELGAPNPLEAATTLAKASAGGAQGSIEAFVAGLVFSSLGFIGLVYGRRTGNFKAMALGGALMTYPYLINGLVPTVAVGVVLTVALWRARRC